MLKKILEWIKLKEVIHKRIHAPPLFKEGEIWWCYIGENVGIEINGKSDEFTRPMLILKKYDYQSFLSLPLTTKVKIGTWYVPIKLNGNIQTVTLVQGRVLDFRRLKEKIGQLDSPELSKVWKGYLELHSYNPIKIDLPPSTEGVVGDPKSIQV